MFEANKIRKNQAPQQAPAPANAVAGQQATEKDKALLEAEKVFREGVVSVRDVIAPASMKVENNLLRLNNLYV